MSLKQKVLNTLADPNIAYLLMMAGLLGLYMEFSHPGVIFPGVVGAICLLLALASFQLLPINYTGLTLIALGVGLLVGEMFVPSFGFLGIGGIIALALGSLLLFDTESSDLIVDKSIIFTAVGTVGAIHAGDQLSSFPHATDQADAWEWTPWSGRSARLDWRWRRRDRYLFVVSIGTPGRITPSK